MKKTRTKTLAVVALTSAMTACVAGGIGYAKLNHAVFASADTANYYAERSNVFSGTGTLTQTESATFTLTGVMAGQYSVTVEITHTEGTSEEWFYLSATGNGDAVFLTEGNVSTGKYYGVVNVGENGTLTISSTSPNIFTVKVSLDTLFMNADSGYSLGNVNFASSFMPISIDLSDTTARDFTVQVDLGDRILGTDETLTADIDGESKDLVAQTEGFALYSATITLPDDVKEATNLTITSTIDAAESEGIVGSVALFPLGTVTPITTNTATAKNVGVWETAIFSYTPSVTGYRSVDVTSTTTGVESVEVSTTVALAAGTFNGTPIVDKDYPVYLEAGTTYYFESVLTNIIPDTISSADLTITLSDWTRPTVEVGGSYALPVTTADETPEMFTLTAAEGTYDLTITEVPYDYYLTGVTVTAHITYAAGTPAVQEVVLDSDNNYSEEVKIAANAEKIYFTTSQNSRSVIRVSLTEPEVINYIVPGTPKTINVPANGSITYFIEKAAAGVYSLELTKTSSSVSVMVGDITIIPEGKTMGGFVVQYEGNDFGITFVNSSDAEVEITAMVAAEAQDTTIQLDTPKTITLAANQRQAFFMYSLAAGKFELTVDPADGLFLTVDGEEVDISSGKATITISDVQDTNGLVNFTFESTAATTFTVTVAPQNIVNVGEEFSITTSEYYYYVAYYVKGLKANTQYYMVLDLPQGVSVTVSQNGSEFVYYGNAIGVFTAESDSYVTLRFGCYTYGDLTTIKAYIDEYKENTVGTMTVDTATNITVEGRYATYTLNLTEGLYYISVLGDVEATINGTLVSNSISYYAYGNETVRVTFINFTGEKATATATVVTDVMNVGEEKAISLAADSSKVYGIDLEKGVFTLTLSASENIEVRLDNVVVAPVNGTYRLDVTMSGGHTLTFVNTGASEVSFTATVTPNNLLTLGEEKEITLGAGSSDIYYIYLETGEYEIALTFADGSQIEVYYNGTQIVYPGGNYGYITIMNNGYVTLNFRNAAATEVTFTVTVTLYEE